MKNTQIYKIEVDKSGSIRLLSYSLVLLFIALIIFGEATGSYQIGPESLILSMVIYIFTLMFHEFVHGFFFWLFGGKPKYGVGFAYVLPYAYATSPGSYFAFRQMLIIGLAPFVLISAATLTLALLSPFLAPFLAVAFIGNFGGAIGDIWMANRIWKFRRFKDLRLVDLKDGIAVHSSNVEAIKVAKQLEAAADSRTAKNRFINRWIVTALVLFAIVAVVPTLFAAFKVQGNILLGWENFPIIQYSSESGDGKQYEYVLNMWPPIFAGLIFSSLLALKDAVKNKE